MYIKEELTYINIRVRSFFTVSTALDRRYLVRSWNSCSPTAVGKVQTCFHSMKYQKNFSEGCECTVFSSTFYLSTEKVF